MCKMSDSLVQQKLTHFKSPYFKLKVQKRILRKTNALSCSNVQQGTQESGRQGNVKIKLKKRTARQTCLYHYGIKRLGVCVCVCVHVHAHVLSHVQLCDLWTVAHQAPPSMGFSRQEYWSGLPRPPPGDLANPGIGPVSPSLAGRFFTTEPPGKSHKMKKQHFILLKAFKCLQDVSTRLSFRRM